ncbi:MAG TPA: SRPBCC family protein [Gemmatimonadaceae bacterium]|nr:SRPBCC family protein [Gemmatimonadaceae bacterium]
MAFVIQEKFRVQAPADSVWSYLIDPRRVVDCLPGAELVEVVDEVTFLGKVKIKVGPVTAGYTGQARFAQLTHDERRVQIVAEAKEAGGAGAARMTMTSQVLAVADGMAEVIVESRMDVAGKIIQFGRGMVEGVSRQLFRQFSQCIRGQLETSDASGTTAEAETRRASQPIRVIPLASRAAWETVTGQWRVRGKGAAEPTPEEEGEEGTFEGATEPATGAATAGDAPAPGAATPAAPHGELERAPDDPSRGAETRDPERESSTADFEPHRDEKMR